MKSFLYVFILLALFLMPTHALSAPESIPWRDLGTTEQGILKPLQSQWDELPALRQHRLKKGATRW